MELSETRLCFSSNSFFAAILKFDFGTTICPHLGLLTSAEVGLLGEAWLTLPYDSPSSSYSVITNISVFSSFGTSALTLCHSVEASS